MFCQIGEDDDEENDEGDSNAKNQNQGNHHSRGSGGGNHGSASPGVSCPAPTTSSSSASSVQQPPASGAPFSGYTASENATPGGVPGNTATAGKIDNEKPVVSSAPAANNPSEVPITVCNRPTPVSTTIDRSPVETGSPIAGSGPANKTGTTGKRPTADPGNVAVVSTGKPTIVCKKENVNAVVSQSQSQQTSNSSESSSGVNSTTVNSQGNSDLKASSASHPCSVPTAQPSHTNPPSLTSKLVHVNSDTKNSNAVHTPTPSTTATSALPTLPPISTSTRLNERVESAGSDVKVSSAMVSSDSQGHVSNSLSKPTEKNHSDLGSEKNKPQVPTVSTPAKESSVSNDAGLKEQKSALREEEDSNHSTDSESAVPAQLGSHAMNMIMSEYDPLKGKPVAASAAMNMIKDQYHTKLTSSSALPASTNSGRSVEPGSKSHLMKGTSPVTHSAFNKAQAFLLSSSSKGLYANLDPPVKGEPLSGNVKLEGRDVNPFTVNAQGGEDKAAQQGNPLLVSTKKEEAAEMKTEMTSSDPNGTHHSPLINHKPESGTESPRPRSPATSLTNERPSSQTGSPSTRLTPASAHSPSSVKSPVMPAAHMAGAPFGLLGAYRPVVAAGMPGMALGRMPMVSQGFAQPVLAGPTAVFTHPGLVAGHTALPLTAAASGLSTGLGAMYQPLAMPGAVRYASPHAAYIPAPMIHTVPAATGPYSHLGVPGPDPYLAALASRGVHPQAAAPLAAPAAAMYPSLQVAQAQAMPQFAMYPQARVPFQGMHLPRPPT